MSTIVRVEPYPSDEASFYVEEWEQDGHYANFVVDRDHPLANHLQPHRKHTILIVASTEQVEWMVTRTAWGPWWDRRFRVSLQSRASWVRSCVITDEYLEFLGAVS